MLPTATIKVTPGGTQYLWVREGGGQTLVGFGKCGLVYLWVRYLVQIQYVFGVSNKKIRQIEYYFSQRYCSAVAEKAMKPLVFMHHEAMSKFLGSRNVQNLVYFWVFQKYAVSDPLSHTNRSPPPWGSDRVKYCLQWRTQEGNGGVWTPHFPKSWSSRFTQKCNKIGGGGVGQICQEVISEILQKKAKNGFSRVGRKVLVSKKCLNIAGRGILS